MKPLSARSLLLLLAGVQFNHFMDLMRLYSIHQRTLLW
jgi:hypothetical protein